MAHAAVPPEARDATATAALWRLRVEVDEPDAVLVSVVWDRPGGGQETAGFASAGPVQEAGGTDGWELYSIGVEPGLRGSGAADDLLRRVTGDLACVVWVERGNERARSFYARHGFVADGAQRLHEGLGVPEVRLARPAAPH